MKNKHHLAQASSAFQTLVLDFFDQHGRVFPWRTTFDPYHILVSEVMLQQTQTERVVPKFERFIQEFPTLESLAQASPGEVLTYWQGLGYNRRGLNLHRAAQHISQQHQNQVPTGLSQLIELPGIGPYTAAAIQAFAFDLPSVVIETNIRAVYLHHFFAQATQPITDKELLPLIETTLERSSPRRWYSALMDYGAYLKKEFPNPSRKSAHHVKQSKFEGSNRQIRGAILKALLATGPLSLDDLKLQLPPLDLDETKLSDIIEELKKEGFLDDSQTLLSIRS